MADDMSVAERAPERASERSQRYGTIVVVGGGCYGSYYVRQLRRAAGAGAVSWTRVLVVDRDVSCAVSRDADRGDCIELEVSDWRDFFRRYLDDAARDRETTSRDAI